MALVQVQPATTVLSKVAHTIPLSVLVVTNVASPYRNELFKRASSSIERFAVAFQLDHEPGRHWERRPRLPFTSHYLRGRVIAFLGRSITLCSGLSELVAQVHPDVIVACGFSLATVQCMRAARSVGAELVLMNDGIPNTDPTRGVEAAYRRWIVRQSSGFIASCSRSKSYFQILGAAAERTHVVELTTDLQAIRAKTRDGQLRSTTRAAMGLSGHVLCYVGKLVSTKCVDRVIEAFKMARENVPHLTLVIVGDGPERRSLEQLADEVESPSIRFLGHLDAEALLGVYAASDLLVFPAVKERFGMVIIEAMAAGVPAIVTPDAGATSDLVVDGENGFVVPPYDAAAISERIALALNEPGRLRRMSAAAVSVVERHDVAIEASHFVRAIELLHTKAS